MYEDSFLGVVALAVASILFYPDVERSVPQTSLLDIGVDVYLLGSLNSSSASLCSMAVLILVAFSLK